jgi:hypothetical protein
MRLYLGVLGVVMALEVTRSIASSGIYKEKELITFMTMLDKSGEIKLEILILILGLQKGRQ